MVWYHVTPGLPCGGRLAVVAPQNLFREEKASVKSWMMHLSQFLYKEYTPIMH